MIQKNNRVIYKKLTPKNIIIFISVVVFCFYFLPFLILQHGTYIHIHDNLDSVFLYYHHLANSGHLFTFNTDIIFEEVMNGFPIYWLPSSPFIVSLFYLFGSLAGYIINDIVVHLVGFIGMYLLLKRYFIRKYENQYIVIALSLCFALVPFESAYGISVSGQPFLLYAFLNILNKKQNIQDYIFIVFFPFYSWLSMAGVFIICALSTILVVYTISKKKVSYQYLAWLIVFVTLYCVVDYKLIYGTLFAKDFVSHRTDWISYPLEIANWVYFTIKNAADLFFKTQYHTGSFKTYAVILTFIIAFVMALRGKRLKPILVWLPLTIVTICLFYGLYAFLVHGLGLDNFMPFLIMFQGVRFYFLLPILWFLLFAISLNEISKLNKYKYIIYILLVLHFALVGIENRDYRHNLIQVIAKTVAPEYERKLMSFERFFAEKLFSQIKNYISAPTENYRVVSIGIHPSIAQYNGFYTLDSYQQAYPLKYKHKFRRIIAKELEKNKELESYFDTWGNRCYIFVSELRDKCYLECYKNRNYSIDNLEINTKALKELGGKYILSAVSINNYEELSLSYEKLFEDKDSCWKIYLYKAN